MKYLLRSASLLPLLAVPLAASGIGLVSPSASATTPGLGNVYPFYNATAASAPTRYQQVFGSTDFAPLGGPILLTSVAFRPSDASDRGSYALSGSLTLSTTARGEGSLSSDFAANVGPDAAAVFSGARTLSTSKTPAANGTYAFDVVIPFATPFLYDPARGNLLLDFAITSRPPTGTLLVFDSVNVAGDGTARVAYPNNVASGGAGADTSGLVARFEVNPTPEPSALAALGLGAVVFVRGRRRG